MEDSAGDLPGLLHGTSVYLDGNMTGALPNTENLAADPNTLSNPDASANGTPESVKPRRKAREERAQRLAAEQALWVRQKFDLPSSDQLIASFSAALVRSILLQGRIHITTTSICFYAKIFGRITKEAFPFTSLARVKKRRGGFVANAIKIYFLDDTVPPVVIGSLNHRERAFSMIQERLREVNPDAAEARDGDDNASGVSIGNSQGGESEDRSFDEDEYHIDNTAHRLAQSGNHRSADGVQTPLRAPRPPTHRRDVNVRVLESDSSEISSRKSSDIDQHLSRDHPHPEGPPLVWRTQHDAIDRVYGKAYEKKTERARGLLHASVKEVFNVLFVSDWLKHYHDSSNNRDVTFTDWYRGNDGFMVREVNFRKPLGYKIGPKETRVKETQRYSFTEEGGVIVELEGQNLDAPYGDYFVCESFFELIPQANGATTLLIASIAVHFSKSTILRGKIEAGALAETKIAFQRLYDLASVRMEEHLSAAKGRGGTNGQKRTKNSTPLPMSPVKKLRSSENIVLPEIKVNGKETITVEQLVTKTKTDVAETMLPLPTDNVKSETLEVQDSESTKWLRIAAIAALITVCILLLAVLLLLNKMRTDVSALERLVIEAQMNTAGKCEAASCAAGVSG